MLHHDRLAGKLEAAADRRSGVLRVNAVHRDVWFAKAMTAYAEAGIAAQAGWPGLRVQRSGPVWAFGPASQLSISQARTRNRADRVDAVEVGDERRHDQRGFLMKFTRKAQLALTAIAAAAPLALTLPAQASTTSSLCTVTPQAPVFDHLDSSGQKVIKYATTVYCQSGRSIEIQDQRWDDDTWDFIPSADDPYGTTTYNITFNGTTTVDKSVTKTLPDADAWGDDNEEMYHSVRFRVTSNGVTSPWTTWEDSTVVSFHL